LESPAGTNGALVVDLIPELKFVSGATQVVATAVTKCCWRSRAPNNLE
jgi:hypothetical protein